MKFRPIGDRVLIKPEKNPELSESGLIHLVEHRKPETMGTVVAVGEKGDMVCRSKLVDVIAESPEDAAKAAILETVLNMKAAEFLVKVGDDVLFSWMAGQELILEDDERYLLMRESDILAVLED